MNKVTDFETRLSAALARISAGYEAQVAQYERQIVKLQGDLAAPQRGAEDMTALSADHDRVLAALAALEGANAKLLAASAALRDENTALRAGQGIPHTDQATLQALSAERDAMAAELHAIRALLSETITKGGANNA